MLDSLERMFVDVAIAFNASGSSKEDVTRILDTHLRPMLGFRHALCALLHRTNPRSILELSVTSERDAAASMATSLHDVLPQLAHHWLNSQVPHIAEPRRHGPAHRLSLVEAVLVHGQLDATDCMSLLCFCGISADHLPRSLKLIQLITPHLHSRLCLLHRESNRVHVVLSPAEGEVAQQLALGRTNKQIAKSLGKSEATVRNQVHAIFGKVSARTRAEAVRRLSEL